MITKKYSGLSDSEVEQSRKEHGSNGLTPPEQSTFMQELWETFKGDPLIKILTVALIIVIVLAIFGLADWMEGAGIAVAVVLVTVFSTWSEYSNNQLFQKLQAEYSKILCKVFRNGKITEVLIDDIVKDDYIKVESGDMIPADGIILDGSIKVNQAALNGEAEDVTKKPLDETDGVPEGKDGVYDLQDGFAVFRGAVVTDNEAVMQVTSVGDKSMFGKLAAELAEDEERPTPLKLKLSSLADLIAKCGYIGGIAIAVAFMFDSAFIEQNILPVANAYFSMANFPQIFADLVQALILAIVIIVVAVPEGLPMMIALVSGLNMKKLLKDNILIRKIDGAETAGSLNLLFSDKTGTITKGALQVSKLYIGKECVATNEADVASLDLQDKTVVAQGILGNTVCARNWDSDGKLQLSGGNGTEKALQQFLSEDRTSFEESIVGNIPFNSTNKFSATELKTDSGRFTLIKGAPEKIIDACSQIYVGRGIHQKLTAELREEVYGCLNSMAEQAMRVLAFAYTDSSIEDVREGGLPAAKDLTLAFYVGIRDEIRPEAITSISMAKRAGIQVVMITGDRKDTATAIAMDAGLIGKVTEDLSDAEHLLGNSVLTHDDLEEMSDEKIKQILPEIRVIARAIPTDKSRLVRVAQELNLVVGMTGDGVNDAPALKKADVGFAMGSGTEVAKEAAEITILDNNFQSVVKTVLYGRTIYNNIRKFIIFQLTINVAAVLISFICPLLGLHHPLSVTQMLWVNMIMDTLAALAFGGEPALDRYMDEKPKRRDESIISKRMAIQIFGTGGYVVGISLWFLFGKFMHGMFRNSENDVVFLTGFFCFFIFTVMLNGLNTRTEHIDIFDNVSKNKNFLLIMAGVLGMQVLMVLLQVPILRVVQLTVQEWVIVVTFSLFVLPVGMLMKAIAKLMTKSSAVKAE